jgi:hypothetical protein
MLIDPREVIGEVIGGFGMDWDDAGRIERGYESLQVFDEGVAGCVVM